jgi:hypothetical protein
LGEIGDTASNASTGMHAQASFVGRAPTGATEAVGAA